jgi:hypothetical protein
VRTVNRSGTADGLPASMQVMAGDAYDGDKNIRVTPGATTVISRGESHG